MPVEDTLTKRHIRLRDRVQKPAKPIGPDDSSDDGDGPKRPKVDKPETEELLRRMRRVDKGSVSGVTARERVSDGAIRRFSRPLKKKWL